MRHGTDKLSGGITQKVRVGIERNDITGLVEIANRTGFDRECIGIVPGQKGVQGFQFAALALITDPFLFTDVPFAGTVQGKKRAFVIIGVFPVQFVDQAGQPVNQRRIVWHRFPVGIDKVGQKAEFQPFVTIGEIVDFEVVAQFFNLFFGNQHGRYHDKRFISFRDTF